MIIVNSLNTMEARRQWNSIFKILKENNCNFNIVYIAKYIQVLGKQMVILYF